jgi:plastocyanin
MDMLRLRVSLAVLATVAAGCGGPSGTADAGVADAAVFNGCTEGQFVDRSAAGADRAVAFGGENGSPVFGYSPACITIAAGQSVTFRGAFSGHPLRPGANPSMPTAGSPGSPITNVDTGMSAEVAFATAGTFPYYCEYHWGGGMYGVVRVR